MLKSNPTIYFLSVTVTVNIFLFSLTYETKPEYSRAETKRQFGYAWSDLKSKPSPPHCHFFHI